MRARRTKNTRRIVVIILIRDVLSRCEPRRQCRTTATNSSPVRATTCVAPSRRRQQHRQQLLHRYATMEDTARRSSAADTGRRRARALFHYYFYNCGGAPASSQPLAAAWDRRQLQRRYENIIAVGTRTRAVRPRVFREAFHTHICRRRVLLLHRTAAVCDQHRCVDVVRVGVSARSCVSLRVRFNFIWFPNFFFPPRPFTWSRHSAVPRTFHRLARLVMGRRVSRS